jgi:hypothetical protein
MTRSDLHSFKQWFTRYTGSFQLSDTTDRKNISLKITHTRHVCENMLIIAEDQSLGENEMWLAETIALFHDIGTAIDTSYGKTALRLNVN